MQNLILWQSTPEYNMAFCKTKMLLSYLRNLGATGRTVKQNKTVEVPLSALITDNNIHTFEVHYNQMKVTIKEDDTLYCYVICWGEHKGKATLLKLASDAHFNNIFRDLYYIAEGIAKGSENISPSISAQGIQSTLDTAPITTVNTNNTIKQTVKSDKTTPSKRGRKATVTQATAKADTTKVTATKQPVASHIAFLQDWYKKAYTTMVKESTDADVQMISLGKYLVLMLMWQRNFVPDEKHPNGYGIVISMRRRDDRYMWVGDWKIIMESDREATKTENFEQWWQMAEKWYSSMGYRLKPEMLITD